MQELEVRSYEGRREIITVSVERGFFELHCIDQYYYVHET
jgi:hypothetical protein